MAYSYSILPGGTILRSDGACVPPDQGNKDYREYLGWVAAGNTATVIAAPVLSIAQQREPEYAKAGVTFEAKVNALWDKVMNNNSTSADAIAAKIAEVDGRIK